MLAYDKAKADIAAGRAKAHALWVILSNQHDRDGYAIRPDPWEGPGRYQHVSYGDAPLGVFIRIPIERPSLPCKN